MDPKLQKQHENMGVYDIIVNLRQLYQEKVQHERFDVSKVVFQARLTEGNLVGPHGTKRWGKSKKKGKKAKGTSKCDSGMSVLHSGPLAPIESTNSDLARDLTSKTEKGPSEARVTIHTQISKGKHDRGAWITEEKQRPLERSKGQLEEAGKHQFSWQ
ncbi:hypothetical protein CRG98_039155 [Punica granatum]|uniref:Uncharacterized protein n=1 Tax=Punica granatum TaxID=22663 RepID=A0A2I0I8Z3_PUNGR|nr:hypothetical protein CRG98_039155 [Punica granatum]